MEVSVNEDVDVEHLIELLASVGWGKAEGYSRVAVRRSINAYPFHASAISPEGRLVGYLSAFSDGAFSVWIGELIVHPAWQRRGVARDLLRSLENRYPNLPIYGNALKGSVPFFEACGFTISSNMVSIHRTKKGEQAGAGDA
jgi:GNAT superfamily N-acetyltransferase